MIIIDSAGKEKNAISLKVITHEVRDGINKEAIPAKFVEAVIQGKHRKETWVEWYPLAEFKRNNPHIKL